MLRQLSIVCATLLLSAAPAFAEKSEDEAVGVFTQLCILSEAQPSKADILAQAMMAAKRIPVAALAPTGIKADNAWFIKTKSQELLVTMIPGICALHVKTGDGAALKKEFVRVGQMYAQSVKAEWKQLEDKQNGETHFTSYGLEMSDNSQAVFAITTADKENASGTKHLLTFSPKVK